MKKKSILISGIILAIVLIIFFFKNFYGWKEIPKNSDTPSHYLSLKKVTRDNYNRDSLNVVGILKEMRIKKMDFFNNKSYNDSTVLIIDTLLYSPNLNKIAVLLITKNLTSNQLSPDKTNLYYFDATCYLGIRNKDSISLKWIGPLFTNSPEFNYASQDIRLACLRSFATHDTTDDYEFNMNDIRFWDSKIWKRWE